MLVAFSHDGLFPTRCKVLIACTDHLPGLAASGGLTMFQYRFSLAHRYAYPDQNKISPERFLGY